ncbi:uncharacterized protein LOC111371092 [Olea europaea var. sylvestris]|uniref:uncharacterized protein LOC111371092 n=1 Tax=Olea europaea var. sylvestris TaxID=158386 RepID=UPI000C1D5F4A|nr:uncharacterized protein LOC111371092 [Olea europaea var. sylvestris]
MAGSTGYWPLFPRIVHYKKDHGYIIHRLLRNLIATPEEKVTESKERKAILECLIEKSMNRRGEGMHRKISNSVKDRDEELSFFRDIQKREKDEIASLLQPVSNEFEVNGNYGLHRMEFGRKGPTLEFLAESGKNDYNWLKTPPATPLFPSLEMETNAPEMVIQRDLPIIQPLSRFAGNSEEVKANTNKSTYPNPKPKIPQRYKTPNGRPTIPPTDKKNAKSAPVINQKMNQSNVLLSTISLTDKKNVKSAPVLDQKKNQSHTVVTEKLKTGTTPVKYVSRRGSQPNFLTSNLSKSMGMDSNSISNTKPKSRGVSPSTRPTIPSQISGVSDETPHNLRTDRSISTTRERPDIQNRALPQKQDSNPKARRQSCSPSVTRGRKVDNDGKITNQTAAKLHQGNKGQVLGSKMVDKFMNARMSSAEERQAKVKMNGSINESSGFGRLMSKSSLDMALKHMVRIPFLVSQNLVISPSNHFMYC